MNENLKMILGLTVISLLMALAIAWFSNTFALHGLLLIIFAVCIGSFTTDLYEYCDSIIIKIGKSNEFK